MNDGKGRNLGGLNRSWVLTIALCALLLGSLSWNVWQYRVVGEQRRQAVAAERTAIAKADEAKQEAEQTKLRKAKAAKTEERVQELYREINGLTQVNEHILLPKQTSRDGPVKTDDLQQAGTSP